MIKILNVKPCTVCPDITIKNSGNLYVITLGYKDLRLPVCIYIINLYLEHEIELLNSPEKGWGL